MRIAWFTGAHQCIDLGNGDFEILPADSDPLHDTLRRRAATGVPDCGLGIAFESVGPGDEGLSLRAPGAEPRRIVVESRERGYHDHGATIWGEFFSRDCRYPVFWFDH